MVAGNVPHRKYSMQGSRLVQKGPHHLPHSVTGDVGQVDQPANAYIAVQENTLVYIEALENLLITVFELKLICASLTINLTTTAWLRQAERNLTTFLCHYLLNTQ